MRQTKPTRIAIAFISLWTAGSLTQSLFADEPPLSIPTLTPGTLTDPASDPATEKQFERALRGESVQANTPMLQDLLNAAQSIGSVLDRETAPAATRSPNGPTLSPNTNAFPPQTKPFPRRPAGSPRVQTTEIQPGDRPGPIEFSPPGPSRDRNTIAPPSLLNPPASLAPRSYNPRGYNPPQSYPPSPPQRASEPGNQDDRFYAAEMLLRTARLLGEVSPSDPSQQQLVAAMRSQAVRLMSTPAPPPVAIIPPQVVRPR